MQERTDCFVGKLMEKRQGESGKRCARAKAKRPHNRAVGLLLVSDCSIKTFRRKTSNKGDTQPSNTGLT